MKHETVTKEAICIWLVTLSGVGGIIAGYQEIFLMFTPLQLLLYIIIIMRSHSYNSKQILMGMIPFIIGWFVEYLGVNHGLIFGHYSYGSNLGWKILGVPLIIGVNWSILVYCSASLVRRIFTNVIISSIFASLLMVLLDLIIEQSAPRFDFWEFKGGIVPMQNYIGWFCTAFGIHLLFQSYFRTFNYKIALHIFLAITVFFTFFLFF